MKKQIQELKACIYDTENVYSKLNQLSGKIQKVGVIIAIISAIMGLITAFSLINTSLLGCLIVIFICALNVAFQIFAFFGIALIIEALGSIVYNTSLPARHDLYEMGGNSDLSCNSWNCKKCGANNATAVRHCASCGEDRKR